MNQRWGRDGLSDKSAHDEHLVTNAPFWTKRAEVLWKIIKERLKTDLNYFPRKKNIWGFWSERALKMA